MMFKGCGCFHHIISALLAVLAMLSGILFFWGAINQTLVFGFDPGFYVSATLVLALMGHSTRVCRCCCGGWKCAADKCGACKIDGKDGGACKHEMGCKCGDCDRCK